MPLPLIWITKKSKSTHHHDPNPLFFASSTCEDFVWFDDETKHGSTMWLLLRNRLPLVYLLMNVAIENTDQSIVDGRSDEFRHSNKRTLQLGAVPQITSIQVVDATTASSVLNISTTDNNVINIDISGFLSMY